MVDITQPEQSRPETSQPVGVVFESQQTRIVPTPFRVPNANSYSERWVRSVREECLDRILILDKAHLRRVLNVYLAYYNKRRPHQGLEQQSPIPRPEPATTGEVKRRQILGSIRRIPKNNIISP